MHKSADGRNRGSIISGDFMWSGTNELEPSKFVFWVGVPHSECSKSGCVVLCIAYIVRTQLQIRFYRCFVWYRAWFHYRNNPEKMKKSNQTIENSTGGDTQCSVPRFVSISLFLFVSFYVSAWTLFSCFKKNKRLVAWLKNNLPSSGYKVTNSCSWKHDLRLPCSVRTAALSLIIRRPDNNKLQSMIYFCVSNLYNTLTSSKY